MATVEPGKKVRVTITPRTASGREGKVDMASVVWESSDEGVATVVADEGNKLSAVVEAEGTGEALIVFEADVDMGEDIKTVRGVGTIIVPEEEVTAFEMTFGEPFEGEEGQPAPQTAAAGQPSPYSAGTGMVGAAAAAEAALTGRPFEAQPDPRAGIPVADVPAADARAVDNNVGYGNDPTSSTQGVQHPLADLANVGAEQRGGMEGRDLSAETNSEPEAAAEEDKPQGADAQGGKTVEW